MTPSKKSVENRLNNLEDAEDVPTFSLGELFRAPGQEATVWEHVGGTRDIWQSDDGRLRRGPTKQEGEEADDLLDAMVRDEEELKT